LLLYYQPIHSHRPDDPELLVIIPDLSFSSSRQGKAIIQNGFPGIIPMQGHDLFYLISLPSPGHQTRRVPQNLRNSGGMVFNNSMRRSSRLRFLAAISADLLQREEQYFLFGRPSKAMLQVSQSFKTATLYPTP